MDQLTAYRILRLEPGCSVADIKAAYATLSKEYHPEEQPEEFQKIREAYVTLTRGSMRGRGNAAEQEFSYSAPSQRMQQQHTDQQQNINQQQEQQADRRQESRAEQVRQEKSWDFDSVLQQEQERKQEEEHVGEQQNDRQWDFDSTLHQAEQNEQARLFHAAQKALIEIEMVLAPENRNKMKLYQRFFKKEEYQPVLKTPAFMGGFARLLENVKLKKNIYDYIIDYYRFRGLNPNEMFPEAKALYYVLDQKRGMNAKQKGNVAYVIPIAVIAGLRAAVRSVGTDGGFGVIIFVVVLAVALIWLYRTLYKNRSSLFAQAIVAVVIIVSQFIVLMGDFYEPLMGYENGTFVAAILFLLGVVWLGVVGVVALVQKIKSVAGRKR